MEKKYPIANGGCAARFQCSNINKKCCKPEPEKGKRFVYCEYFKKNENKH